MVKKYFVSPSNLPDQKISSVLGVSPAFVTSIFLLFTLGVETAKIDYLAMIQGQFMVHGDMTLLWFVAFIILASVIITIQHLLFETENNEDTDKIIQVK